MARYDSCSGREPRETEPRADARGAEARARADLDSEWEDLPRGPGDRQLKQRIHVRTGSAAETEVALRTACGCDRGCPCGIEVALHDLAGNRSRRGKAAAQGNATRDAKFGEEAEYRSVRHSQDSVFVTSLHESSTTDVASVPVCVEDPRDEVEARGTIRREIGT